MNPFFILSGISAVIGAIIEWDKKQGKKPDERHNEPAIVVPTSAPTAGNTSETPPNPSE